MLVDRRVVRLSLLAIGLGVVAAGVSFVFMRLIALITNIAFFQQLSLAPMPPAANQLGVWVIVVPIVGGLIVGFMARYGSKAIRGHGIPEAMEQVLTNESRIPARITFLKAAVGRDRDRHRWTVRCRRTDHRDRRSTRARSFGQLVSTTAAERKTLLAAGAAAGMAATFGSPVSAVLLGRRIAAVRISGSIADSRGTG